MGMHLYMYVNMHIYIYIYIHIKALEIKIINDKLQNITVNTNLKFNNHITARGTTPVTHFHPDTYQHLSITLIES